jgi:hypothetical protein
LNNNFRQRSESIYKFKIKKDGPYEFALDVVDNQLIIVEILPDGIIHKHGGLLVNDELKELNGVKFDPANFYECIHLLESALDDNKSVRIDADFF